MEAWHRFLLSRLSLPPPPNFKKIGMDQLLRCDRAAWVRLAEVAHSLKRDAAGDLPLDKAFPALQGPSCPASRLPSIPRAVGKVGAKTRRGSPRTLIPMIARKVKARAFQHRCKKRGSNMSAVRQACAFAGITCKFAKAGEQCKRGLHLCMRCEQTHPLFECKAKAGG